MDYTQSDKIAGALEKIAKALGDIADCLANDEPLNYSVMKGLSKIAESIGKEKKDAKF